MRVPRYQGAKHAKRLLMGKMEILLPEISKKNVTLEKMFIHVGEAWLGNAEDEFQPIVHNVVRLWTS